MRPEFAAVCPFANTSQALIFRCPKAIGAGLTSLTAGDFDATGNVKPRNRRRYCSSTSRPAPLSTNFMVQLDLVTGPERPPPCAGSCQPKVPLQVLPVLVDEIETGWASL